jgi:hypothetical protein
MNQTKCMRCKKLLMVGMLMAYISCVVIIGKGIIYLFIYLN